MQPGAIRYEGSAAANDAWARPACARRLPPARPLLRQIQEETVGIQNRNALHYSGVADRGWWADYLDSNTFLEAFLSGPGVIGTGWNEPAFDVMLSDANAAPSSRERMRGLAQCERLLLRAMPVLPLYCNVQAVLRKPFVRGLSPAKVGSARFKYAWIDTNWRPS